VPTPVSSLAACPEPKLLIVPRGNEGTPAITRKKMVLRADGSGDPNSVYHEAPGKQLRLYNIKETACLLGLPGRGFGE